MDGDARGDAPGRRHLAAALQHLPACPRPDLGGPVCASRHAGPLCGRLRRDVSTRGPRSRKPGRRVSAVLTRLGLELHPEKTRTGRSLAGTRGLRLPRVSPAQAHERPHLGADAATRLLPAAVAVTARDAAGAHPRPGADPSWPLPRGPAHGHRGRECGGPWVGAVLSDGQCGDCASSNSTATSRSGCAGLLAQAGRLATGGRVGRRRGAVPSSRPWDSVGSAAPCSIRGRRNAAT